MKIYLLLSASFLFFTSFGQTDTTKIYNCTQLKRGLYKNYKEFIANNPSIVTEFSVTTFAKSKTDTTVVGADFQLLNKPVKQHNIWGFCDGKDVYVNYSGNNFTSKYWKLLNLGPNPFFYLKIKEIFMVGGPLMMIATAALSASIPSHFELMRINKKGYSRDLGIVETCDLLEIQPNLLKEFKAKTDRHLNIDPDPRRNKTVPPLTDAEQQKQQNLIIEYVSKLNDILKKG